jgi:hypothetical protein
VAWARAPRRCARSVPEWERSATPPAGSLASAVTPAPPRRNAELKARDPEPERTLTPGERLPLFFGAPESAG